MANVDSPNFRYGKNYNYTNFVIDLIRTPYTLNIFTDVSTRNLTDKLGKQITHSCYGAIGVNMDTIIEESYGLANDCTSEKGEISGGYHSASRSEKCKRFSCTCRRICQDRVREGKVRYRMFKGGRQTEYSCGILYSFCKEGRLFYRL